MVSHSYDESRYIWFHEIFLCNDNVYVFFFLLWFQSTQKSIGSNDTAHSTVSQTTTSNNEPDMRENGNTGVNHVHGTGNGSVGSDGATNNSEPQSQGLNLKMSAKELREQLAKRKKYDPKKESIGFKDKFDIVQKL